MDDYSCMQRAHTLYVVLLRQRHSVNQLPNACKSLEASHAILFSLLHKRDSLNFCSALHLKLKRRVSVT